MCVCVRAYLSRMRNTHVVLIASVITLGTAVEVELTTFAARYTSPKAHSTN
jgi:hypothetical protein